MTLFPALLTIMPMKASAVVDRQSRSMEWLANLVISAPPANAGHAGFNLIGTALLPRLTFNDRFVEYFDERVDFRQASDWAADNLTGIYIINYSLESGDIGAVSTRPISPILMLLPIGCASNPKWCMSPHFPMSSNALTAPLMATTKLLCCAGKPPIGGSICFALRNVAAYGLDLNDQLNVDKSASRMVVTLEDLSTAEMKVLRAARLTG